jgi:hypothetical protein
MCNKKEKTNKTTNSHSGKGKGIGISRGTGVFTCKKCTNKSFWSLNPNPTNSDYVKNTPKLGFQTILDREQLFNNCKELVTNDMYYFYSYKTIYY